MALDVSGRNIYRFRASDHKHLCSLFIDDPWALPSTSVGVGRYGVLTLEEVDGRYATSEEFDRLWKASAPPLRPRGYIARATSRH